MFRYIYRFATLYDIKNKIPVFSAYTYNGIGGKSIPRPAWKIEPQLDQQIYPNMALANRWINYRHQAVKKDYASAENSNLSKGHMFPKAFATDEDTQNSTFTFTNCVPQSLSCNNGKWRSMEEEVQKTIKKNCLGVAYLVTGAVPSVNNMLNGRVNIPSHLWTAYCCYNKNLEQWIAKAYWFKNVDNCNKTRGTLSKLYKELGVFYQNGKVYVSLFSQKCPVDFDLMLAGEDEEVESGDGFEGADDDFAPL
ncbi:hypothetical protein UPYG_G00245440 [Umbra pygmaea]|uniref:Endonuclease domain-containing 1 protein-like n=1 Tax=Umbra pygmaea TaxID=75934 RepID=A0ABD0WGD3_UMBPY